MCTIAAEPSLSTSEVPRFGLLSCPFFLLAPTWHLGATIMHTRSLAICARTPKHMTELWFLHCQGFALKLVTQILVFALTLTDHKVHSA